jgi:phosphoribosylglycinamide formyltransferase-1
MKTQIKKIILLASGNGSNVENIIKYFDKNSSIRIVLVAGNNKNAFVFERVKPYDIQTLVFDKSSFNKQLIKIIDQNEADLLVLAGFLWKIPESVIDRYPNKIINIHPSLLPKFGGKGMYGNNVHKAVMESKEVKTGISIHIVNKEYDKGSIIFQVGIPIMPLDDFKSIAKKVQDLEKEHFPRIIKNYILNTK